MKTLDLTAEHLLKLQKTGKEDLAAVEQDKIIDAEMVENIFYSLEDSWPNEMNLLLLISSCPVGLTHQDLQAITAQDTKFYGKWELFL